ncbi:MAG: ABC transporter permease, partial [Eubacteriales bacterium]|nr:ABC transporter permease [Eubacteriales bacterium]
LIVVYFILRRTMFGRGFFAIGGDESAARRAGFKVDSIRIWTYGIVGVLASLAGFTRVCMMGQCQPANLFGMEMLIIAAVVLGGASLVGGSGTVHGTMLGISLLTIMQISLLLLGIPLFWQKFVSGVIIVIGMGLSGLKAYNFNRKSYKEKRG